MINTIWVKSDLCVFHVSELHPEQWSPSQQSNDSNHWFYWVVFSVSVCLLREEPQRNTSGCKSSFHLCFWCRIITQLFPVSPTAALQLYEAFKIRYIHLINHAQASSNNIRLAAGTKVKQLSINVRKIQHIHPFDCTTCTQTIILIRLILTGHADCRHEPIVRRFVSLIYSCSHPVSSRWSIIYPRHIWVQLLNLLRLQSSSKIQQRNVGELGKLGNRSEIRRWKSEELGGLQGQTEEENQTNEGLEHTGLMEVSVLSDNLTDMEKNLRASYSLSCPLYWRVTVQQPHHNNGYLPSCLLCMNVR